MDLIQGYIHLQSSVSAMMNLQVLLSESGYILYLNQHFHYKKCYLCKLYTFSFNFSGLKLSFHKLFSRNHDRVYSPVARVPGYRSRGPGFDSRRYQIF
jgi:hypothetical protein